MKISEIRYALQQRGALYDYGDFVVVLAHDDMSPLDAWMRGDEVCRVESPAEGARVMSQVSLRPPWALHLVEQCRRCGGVILGADERCRLCGHDGWSLRERADSALAAEMAAGRADRAAEAEAREERIEKGRHLTLLSGGGDD